MPEVTQHSNGDSQVSNSEIKGFPLNAGPLSSPLDTQKWQEWGHQRPRMVTNLIYEILTCANVTQGEPAPGKFVFHNFSVGELVLKDLDYFKVKTGMVEQCKEEFLQIE